MKFIEPEKKYVVAYYDHDEPLTATRKEVEFLGIKKRENKDDKVVPFQVSPNGELKRLDDDMTYIGMFKAPHISGLNEQKAKQEFSRRISKNIEQYLWNMD